MNYKIKLLLAFAILHLHANTTYAGSPVIPSQSDWTDVGSGISEGTSGDWDQYFWGAFANSIVKIEDTYYHYYQGSEYYDTGENSCESVANREIGVATSADLKIWTKYEFNPVIEWWSKDIRNPNIEEGAVSSAFLIDQDGSHYMYYGANTHLSTCNVNADARIASTTDNIRFTDMSKVLEGTDTSLWGGNDEIFPLGAYQHQSNYFLFYTPNGSAESRMLGVASGSSRDELTTSVGVNGGTINVWGPVSPIVIGSQGYLFVNSGIKSSTAKDPDINIYTFDPMDPTDITLYDSYHFNAKECSQASIFYSQIDNEWIMACRQDQNYPLDPSGRLRYTIKKYSSTPTQPGDVDGDLDVDYHDYFTLIGHFLSTTFSAGDFKLDGIIDIFDYNLLLQHFGR